MAVMREPQPLLPLAQCMQTWVMPRNALALLWWQSCMLSRRLLKSDVTFSLKQLQMMTCHFDPFPLFPSFSHNHGSVRNGLRNGLAIQANIIQLTPTVCSRISFPIKTRLLFSLWPAENRKVIRKAFPQQPPAFANEMVSNTTFLG